MERPVAAGDRLILRVNDKELSSVILEVDPVIIQVEGTPNVFSDIDTVPDRKNARVLHNIYKPFKLINRNGDWVIDPGVIVSMNFEILKPEVIGYTLGFEDGNDAKWLNKLNKEYPGAIDVKEGVSLYRLYYDLSKNLSADDAARDGLLHVIRYYRRKNNQNRPTIFGANEAAENGHLHVLKWMQMIKLSPDHAGMILATEKGHLEVLKWMLTLTPPLLPDVRVANIAAWNGRLNILEWLSDLTPSILPDVDGAASAARRGKNDVLMWMLKHGVKFNQSVMDEASGGGQLSTIELLHSVDHSLKPNLSDVFHANKSIEAAEVMNRIIPADRSWITLVIRVGGYNRLKWLGERGIDIKLEDLREEIFRSPNNATQLIEWLKKNNHEIVSKWVLLPEEFDMLVAKTEFSKKHYEDYDTRDLSILKALGLYPPYKRLYSAFEEGDLEYIKRIGKVVQYNNYLYRIAVKYGHENVIEYIKEYQPFAADD